jgi:hypothetical protein
MPRGLFSPRETPGGNTIAKWRGLRWSAALAALAIPVIVIVSALTEPRQSLVFNCPNPNSACDGVLVDRAQRWGPSALLLVVAWILVSLVVAAIIDHVGGKSDVEMS